VELEKQNAEHVGRDEVLAWFNGVGSFAMAHRQNADLRLLDPLVVEDFD
jgi:hypothetical protein